MKRNFIEYRRVERKVETEPKLLLRTEYPVKAIASDVRAERIYYYEYSANVSELLLTVTN